MNEVSIIAESLGKKYQIGRQNSASISDRIQSLFRKGTQHAVEEFWALNDVSFEINKGEAVGIIGKNGAGKSTLLKVLSKITHPTSGRFEMNGRVSSLLEVGTGFHPELSGRENIFLNGTILGMSRDEIKTKFDEIVNFSGVGQFLDTAVKHYSSGMYVRLAFSVAAHLEPEILIIDEVLAVGDAEFQKKCLGKMNEVTKAGRTVIFVSHNMQAVEKLCSRAINIEAGMVKSIGNVSQVISEYLVGNNRLNVSKRLDHLIERKGDGVAKFKSYDLLYEGQSVHSVTSGEALTFKLQFDVKMPIRNCRVSLTILKYSNPLFHLATENTVENSITLDNDTGLEFFVPKLPLDIGKYECALYMNSPQGVHDNIPRAFELNVERGSYYESGKNSPLGWEGKVVLVDHECMVK